eukprot:4227445-Pleurochrysis_carterae.AAC.2
MHLIILRPSLQRAPHKSTTVAGCGVGDSASTMDVDTTADAAAVSSIPNGASAELTAPDQEAAQAQVTCCRATSALQFAHARLVPRSLARTHARTHPCVDSSTSDTTLATSSCLMNRSFLT